MGLDWNPLARPKAGHEREFERILELDLEALSSQEQRRVIARFQDISEAPYETLNAPRVGVDPAADEWLVQQVTASGGSLATAKKHMQGYYVLDLLPENPGLPAYFSSGYDGVDRYTFRGDFLDDVSDLLGEELFDDAFSTMNAAELKAYGERILAIARAFAAEHGLQHLEAQREPPDDEQASPQARAHVLFAAAHWCLFWSERGHGLEPSY